MTLSFNLLDEPWIRAVTPAGRTKVLSLPDTLARAHELRALSGASPLEAAAITRLLLAVLHRSFAVDDASDWRALYAAGRFDEGAVTTYLQPWRSCFDLFDADRPFFQVAGLALNRKPASDLVPERSKYGNQRDLFEHRPAGAPASLPFSAAARLLCRIQSFHLGGTISGDRKAGDPTSASASPLSGIAVVVVAGTTLHETLMLNLLPGDVLASRFTSGNDVPAWERPAPVTPQKRPCDGWRDLLTWQSRRLLLVPDHDEAQVEEIVLAGGFDLEMPEGFRDPMGAYQAHDKYGLLPLSFRPDRVLWRDASALLASEGAHAKAKPPLTIEALRSRSRSGVLAGRQMVDLTLLGQANNQAKYIFTRSERIPVAVRLLDDEELVHFLEAALSDTDQTSLALRRAIRRHAEAACHTSDKATLTKMVESTRASTRFWSDMRVHFDALMVDLNEDEGVAFDAFAARRRQVALSAYDRAIEGLGVGATALRGAVLGRSFLHRELQRIEHPNPTGEDMHA